MSGKRRSIGLLDHLGGGNLGDDTTLLAVMQNVRSRWSGAVIYGFSMNPVDTERRHGITAFPIRRMIWANPDRVGASKAPVDNGPGQTRIGSGLARFLHRVAQVLFSKPRTVAGEIAFLARSLRVMRTLDVFVISGGGQLLDSWGGPWAYPYTIYKWVALTRLAGTKCLFVNVGAGPLQQPLSKFFVRQALRLADYVSFRDPESRALAYGIGFRGAADVCPDCVYALDVAEFRRAAAERRNEIVVGLSPMAYCDPRRYWRRDQPVYDAFVKTFACFGTWLAHDYHLEIFSTDIWFDAQTLDRIERELQTAASVGTTPRITRAAVDSLDSLLVAMSQMDFIVTCRFHGVIFAHLMNIPVIALSHHPKVSTLMAELGLSEYCLDIESFDVMQLTETFARLVANADSIRARMANATMKFRTALTEQFDRLFALEEVR